MELTLPTQTMGQLHDLSKELNHPEHRASFGRLSREAKGLRPAGSRVAGPSLGLWNKLLLLLLLPPPPLLLLLQLRTLMHRPQGWPDETLGPAQLSSARLGSARLAKPSKVSESSLTFVRDPLQDAHLCLRSLLRWPPP